MRNQHEIHGHTEVIRRWQGYENACCLGRGKAPPPKKMDDSSDSENGAEQLNFKKLDIGEE